MKILKELKRFKQKLLIILRILMFFENFEQKLLKFLKFSGNCLLKI